MLGWALFWQRSRDLLLLFVCSCVPIILISCSYKSTVDIEKKLRCKIRVCSKLFIQFSKWTTNLMNSMTYLMLQYRLKVGSFWFEVFQIAYLNVILLFLQPWEIMSKVQLVVSNQLFRFSTSCWVLSFINIICSECLCSLSCFYLTIPELEKWYFVLMPQASHYPMV